MNGESLPSSAHPSPRLQTVHRRERLIWVFLLLVILLNLIVSVAWPLAWYALVTKPVMDEQSSDCTAETCPPSPASVSEMHEHYWDRFWYAQTWTLLGYHLILAPIGMAFGGLGSWWPWQPFVWLAAFASSASLVFLNPGLPTGRRVLYAVVLAFLVSGFGASHWTTIGN